ncbi:phosphatase PAP2 family protein [Streptomyces sp. LP05-1]|uniref:Phosphatase PAP2 family protein n=1 Tax=Streptomyces pyxinae TaxID=2970734 RepID=A0ABT2CLL7_9ACTN|nr:phosphatase PAP2 family protein [Streptomyces sp. LP05-1]MCS0638323.1 phosphatase PAP2 family protein [Streptomyces sp. LP05-1]
MRTDIFARLDREPEPPKIEIPRMSRTRLALFGGTLAFYVAIVVAVLVSSWLVLLDWKVMLFRPYQQWPELHAWLDYYVVLGQRGPTAVMVAAWLGWRSWRQHTLRPLLALGAALLALNATVGAVKLGLGRLGPHYATQIGSAELFAGGDIFPSGHTANAVVTWGILAYLATTPRARRYLSALSAVVALGVGLTTVYLGTHWLSDVLLGWAAGLLILLGLPWCEPVIARAEALILAARERLRARRRSAPSRPVAAGGPRPALYPRLTGTGAVTAIAEATTATAVDDDPVRAAMAAPGAGRTAPAAATAGAPATAGVAGLAGAAGPSAARTTITQPRPHAMARSERSPVSPTGSRRPPHSRPVAGA